MDHVPPDQQRDAQSALLDRDPLQFVGSADIHLIQQRSDPALLDGLALGLRHVPACGLDQAELADLLLERHPAEQRANLLLDRGRLSPVG